MGLNCGLAAWTTRLFAASMATHAACILFGLLPGWEAHLTAPEGDDGGAGLADAAAMLAAKR